MSKIRVTADTCAVYRDTHRHSCILLDIVGQRVRYVAYSPVELVVSSVSQKEFFHSFEKTNYPVGRAARLYLSFEDGYTPQVSAELRTLLGRIADGKFDRKVELPAVEIPASTPDVNPGEDDTMASAKTPAAKKAAPAAKKGADPKPAAKKGADPKPTAKKAAPADEPSGRGRKPNIGGDAKIKVLAKENPKRGSAAERFALYKNGMTVDEYIAAGGTRADVNWDTKQGFIEVK